MHVVSIDKDLLYKVEAFYGPKKTILAFINKKTKNFFRLRVSKIKVNTIYTRWPIQLKG